MTKLFPIVGAVALALAAAACNQAPQTVPAANSQLASATPASADPLAAYRAPPLPAPGRTDPQAVAMRKRYVDWKVAQEQAAGEAALKQVELFYGLAPNGTSGRVAVGALQRAAG